MIWLLVIFLPPFAVLLVGKPITALLNLFLTIAFWVPGIIHAYIVVKEKKDDKRFEKYFKQQKKLRK
ncbi:YqaE/Pmp3 family membrane protein [Salisediminibacterium halotolerans]|uniref:YqaE/Pmp3 family membrane protein n=1 Tax=Salisediminibacterium halotolerans TaxID=517425 RepID=UPI000F1F44A4|nr:YqaE/Pmp3 family membrane protein [Salisediminibacterium halotolerans]RLJ78320.1 uncharacterized membrane protein YqaE (UPF0057 family) [Actinophytocola xinjiangensis]RPE88341.1 uncharacterized membrane protein YqaE (UPF0057 family) [Salisediminibacterium halotolerans]TWG37296.1 uncharacterized membrane protein YqaE (UPF0057 family) [Salisediminibacterium halotolerans]GEL08760.1 proteolipid membrane potential modulator [Salisediminibacterium halotolerans]